jgi:hypothetical protein
MARNHVGTEGIAVVKRMSWSAVFAGVVVVLIIQLALSLLGIGIGMTTVDPQQQGGTPGATTFGIGAAIWWIVTTLIAVGAGGWVAGRLAGMPRRIDGLLHGLITFGFATLLLFYLVTSTAASLIGGTFSAAGNVLSAAGQGAGGLAGQISSQVSDQALSTVRQEIEAALREAGVDPQRVNLEQEAREIGRQLIQGELSQEDLERTATEMARRTGIPPEQARARLQEWQQSYQQAMDQAEQQARQAADVAASTASQAGIWSFVALLIGGVAGAVGGMIGTPRDLY